MYLIILIKIDDLNMKVNGLRGCWFYCKKLSRFCGDVFVFLLNFIFGVGFVWEDFILVIGRLWFGCGVEFLLI